MTDLERLERRVNRMERRLGAWQVAAVIAVGVACKSAAPPPPPTRLELKTPDGRQSVTIDPSGITISAPQTELRLSAEAASLRGPDGRTELGPGSVEVADAGSTVKLAPSRLEMTSGKSRILLSIENTTARVIADYDDGSRSASLAANPYYGSVVASFFPDDHVSKSHDAQLAADKDGATKTFK
ncbi:MAG TPA: hypothetical protein VGF94_06220 [Kofleriaceae bacterium]|jgi:hypothetical protein